MSVSCFCYNKFVYEGELRVGVGRKFIKFLDEVKDKRFFFERNED